MLFSSIDYFIFLGFALTIFWALRNFHAPRLGAIFALSCLFYMASHPTYIGLLLVSTVLDYWIGQRIDASDDEKVRKRWVALSVASNLGLLGFFKYSNFFIDSLNDGAKLFGYELNLPLLPIILPVGISFYTFQTMSYTIDIYRRQLNPAKNFLEFAVFVTYFPQLVAGPIVRASELLPQLEKRPALRRELVGEGIFLILTGLTKKIVVADYLSVNLVDRAFANPELYTAPEMVVALYAFTAQIYCDFSGYTDVARGSAKLMGYELPENFDRPYLAPNPAEFWRRWHMTLSRWLRDYLYFPLGGSRSGPVRAYWNLWLTMFLIGIWHGAGWTFVIYGALQGTMMVLHRFYSRRRNRPKGYVDALPVLAFKIFLSLQFVVFSRILFRAESLDNAYEVTTRLFSGTSSLAQISAPIWIILIGSFIAHFSPRRIYASMIEGYKKLPPIPQALIAIVVAGLISHVATSEVVPYIYFQF